MATDKKHIAVYLDKAVEDALTAFCTANGMESKKGPMYSAAVNKALSEFFGIESNTPNNKSSNTPGNTPNNILDDTMNNIPDTTGNTPVAHLVINQIMIEESLQERLKESRESAQSLEKLYTQACYQVNNWMDKFKALEEKLEATDALIVFKNNEIAEVNAQLAARNIIIAENDHQISELQNEATDLTETKINLKNWKAKNSKAPIGPIAIGAELPEIEAADYSIS